VDASVWCGLFGKPAPGGNFAFGSAFSVVVDVVGPMANIILGRPATGYLSAS
jgi:hypothetical protein